MRRATFTASAACARHIWRKPTWTRRGFTLADTGSVRDGMVRAGIGTPGLVPTRSFRATEFSTARSAGDSTLRCGFTGLPSIGEVTTTVVIVRGIEHQRLRGRLRQFTRDR